MIYTNMKVGVSTVVQCPGHSTLRPWKPRGMFPGAPRVVHRATPLGNPGDSDDHVDDRHDRHENDPEGLGASYTGDEREGGNSTESSAIQESLIKSLNFEIGAKRNLDQHVQESGEKLKALAEEAKEEMDKAAELAKMRGDLAFDAALADINREADKFERKLRQRREAMERERESMKDWVRDVGQRRNEGQFFGNLYGEYLDEEELNAARKKKRYDDMDPYERQQIMEQRKRVMEPATEEIKSPARMYIFMLLGGMLLVNIFADVMNDQDLSLGIDGLYGALAVIAFWIVFSEQKELSKKE